MQQLAKYSNKSKIYTTFDDTYDKSRNTDDDDTTTLGKKLLVENDHKWGQTFFRTVERTLLLTRFSYITRKILL